ncbi:hypothetical protein BX600DRAFT_440075 [Xylariales sp. PMI_506]|nr:hypothetical protein BX600DRAFT_440075 [Xylariales sp. PMI_506]
MEYDRKILQALEIARDFPDQIPSTTNELLQSVISYVQKMINEEPHNYLISPLQFAVCNFFQGQIFKSTNGRAALKRYWDKTTEKDIQNTFDSLTMTVHNTKELRTLSGPIQSVSTQHLLHGKKPVIVNSLL